MNNYYIMQEYGKPVSIRFDKQEEARRFKEAVEFTSRKWKIRLGVKFFPFESELSNSIVKIRANGITGFLKIGKLNFEIIPKFLEEGEDERWRSALVRGLILTNNNNLFDEKNTLAKVGNGYLVDLIGQRFEKIMKYAIDNGLPSGYLEKEDTLNYYKGRFSINKISQFIINPSKVPCIYDEYSRNCILNRLLKWATIQLSQRVVSRNLSKRLIEIANYMYNIDSELPSINEINNVIIPQQYIYLYDAFSIAKILATSDIILNGEGKFNISGFLWNSHKVYEDILKVIIKRMCTIHDLEFNDKAICLANGNPNLWTTPDIRILKSGITKYVLDAKYKIWSKNPKSNDIYQVVMGAALTKCDICGLIYPKTDNELLSRKWIIKCYDTNVKLLALFIDINLLSEPMAIEKLSEILYKDLIELTKEKCIEVMTDGKKAT